MCSKGKHIAGRRVQPQVALMIGMAAGFAFLIGLGAGMKVLTADMIVVAGFGAVTSVAITLLLNRK